MARTYTFTHIKDNVEYELEASREGFDTIIIENVTVLNGIGVAKPEQDIDPNQFEETLTENDWSKIREVMDNYDDID